MEQVTPLAELMLSCSQFDREWEAENQWQCCKMAEGWQHAKKSIIMVALGSSELRMVLNFLGRPRSSSQPSRPRPKCFTNNFRRANKRSGVRVNHVLFGEETE